MERKLYTEDNNQNFWISTTGYRTLVILKTLMEKNCTIDELVSIIKKNPILFKSTSKDTIRVSINTLKSAGCIFNRPSKANAYKYELISHPFVFKITEDELALFINLRTKFAREITWEEVLILNDVYDKIAALTYNQKYIDEIKNTKPLIKINKEILRKFANPDLKSKKVKIIYSSPEYGDEELEIAPEKIIYENDKLYLKCFSFKYNRNSLLNIERIQKISDINIKETYIAEKFYDVIFEVTGIAVKTFILKENEEIIYQDSNVLKILAHVENEFLFIQRLFLLGCNFRILSPDFFKNKLISKLKLIQKGYDE